VQALLAQRQDKGRQDESEAESGRRSDVEFLFGVAVLMFVEQQISGRGRLCNGSEFRLFSGRFPFVQVPESATAGTHSSVTISNCK